MSIKNKVRDRDEAGRIKRKYTGPSKNWSVAFPNGCPKSWRKMHMTRPKRRQNKSQCYRIATGIDNDGIIFPLGNRKPHYYFW